MGKGRHDMFKGERLALLLLALMLCAWAVVELLSNRNVHPAPIPVVAIDATVAPDTIMTPAAEVPAQEKPRRQRTDTADTRKHPGHNPRKPRSSHRPTTQTTHRDHLADPVSQY